MTDTDTDNPVITRDVYPLAEHVGHDIEIVTYGKDINYSLECADCGVVIVDFDTPCGECNGTGETASYGMPATCPECGPCQCPSCRDA